MRADRAVVVATVVVLACVPVAAGPLFGQSVLSPEPADPGTGSVDATVEEAPDRATLEPKNFSNGSYKLSGPPVPVTLEDLSGRPYLSYTVAVPALDHQTTSLTAIGEAGRHRLNMKPSTLPDGAVTDESYAATITIHVIDDDGRRVILETDVSVEVRE